MKFLKLVSAAIALLVSTSANAAIITLNLSGFITVPDTIGETFSVNVSYESNTPYDPNYDINYGYQGAITAVSGSIYSFSEYSIVDGDPVDTNMLNAVGFGTDGSLGFNVGGVNSGTGMSLTDGYFDTMPIYGFNAIIIPEYGNGDDLSVLDINGYTGSNPGGMGVFNILTGTGDLGGIITEVSIVPVSAVPIPAAVWLFGSGLIGLAGFARRKKA